MPRGIDPTTQPARQPVRGATPSPEDAAVRQLLQRPIAAVEFNEQPLDKIIQWMRDALGANIVVDWKALEAAGVSKDAIVTLQLRNTPFETVLKNVLKVAGGTMPLAYVIEDGVIQISTPPPGGPPPGIAMPSGLSPGGQVGGSTPASQPARIRMVTSTPAADKPNLP